MRMPQEYRMPLYRLSREAAFDQAAISILASAYEAAIRLLPQEYRNDAIKERVAKKIIEIARNGENDPSKICTRTLVELGLTTRA
jgi:hypothetical protein